jgi:hypothetical protein
MQISGERRGEPSSSRNEAEVDGQPSSSEAQQTRKITIQLSECIFLRTDIAMIAEIVALHARYHLTLTPPMPPSKQDEACVLGLERFKAFAEQVDRRVRFGRPLLQEAIDRSGNSSRSGSEMGGGASRAVPRASVEEEPHCVAVVSEKSEACAVAEEGGSNINFRQLPNALC